MWNNGGREESMLLFDLFLGNSLHGKHTLPGKERDSEDRVERTRRGNRGMTGDEEG